MGYDGCLGAAQAAIFDTILDNNRDDGDESPHAAAATALRRRRSRSRRPLRVAAIVAGEFVAVVLESDASPLSSSWSSDSDSKDVELPLKQTSAKQPRAATDTLWPVRARGCAVAKGAVL